MEDNECEEEFQKVLTSLLTNTKSTTHH